MPQQERSEQGFLSKRLLWVAVACLLCFAGLTACGKRPSTLEAPPGGAAYPRTYPAPEAWEKEAAPSLDMKGEK